MVAGIGSGTTVAEVVKAIAEIKPKSVFVPASKATERLAKRLGLRTDALEKYPMLDLTIDGADEVDPNFDLIKGGGGAHTREKIIAKASDRLVIVIDRTKLVRRLGERMPVPVEVLPFGWKFVNKELERMGGIPKLRMTQLGKPFITDNGNYIVDVRFKRILKPKELEGKINSTSGVIENGIFAGMTDMVLVGYEGGCKTIKRKGELLRFIERFES